MSASTNIRDGGLRLRYATPRHVALWPPAGLIYPAMLLGGLAIGFWQRVVFPSDVQAAAPLITLRTVAIAQAAFFLLVHPLMLIRKKKGHPTFPVSCCKEGGAEEKVECPLFFYLIRAAGSSLVFLIVGVPFYVAAAWFGDATCTDVIRITVFVSCLIPLAWSAGFCLARNSAAGTWVFLILLVAALGLPAGYYIGREFLSPLSDFQWLWHLAPITGIWHQSAARVPSFLPHPLWPPATMMLLGLGGLALLRRKRK